MASAASNEGARQLRVGKYNVQNHIATGGMGAVYKALDTVLKREVALKVMNPELASNPGMMERFRREAQAAAKLNHENIISVFEFGEERGTYFIAMEFVDGVDLHTFVQKKGKLSVELAVEVLRQALRALAHAHQQGVVHRDIKPSNFLIVKRKGKLLVKLGDMGLARQERDEDFRLTRAGTTVGTIDYMSPEQAKDSDAADSRSDIYSLGCTLFHMLTGRPPFPEGSMVERMYKHLETAPPDVCQLNETVPPGLAVILAKMLAKKSEDRYQNVEEIQQDLKRMDKLAPPRVASADVLSGLLEESTSQQAPVKSRRSTAPAQAMATTPLAPVSAKTRPTQGAATAQRTGLRSDPPARSVTEPDAAQMDDDDDAVERAAPRSADVPRRNLTPYFVIGGVVLLLIVGGVFALRSMSNSNKVPQTETSSNSSNRVVPSGSGGPIVATELPLHPGKIVWLSPNMENLKTEDVTSIRQDIEKPWASATGPPDITVSRKFAENTGAQQQASLSGALPYIARKESRIVDIADNGPLYDASLVFNDESHVTLRAAKGYRPLIVWDMSRVRDAATAFLTLRQGSLTLEGLDIVLKLPGGSVNDPLALALVVDADFQARGCSFSVVGGSSNGLSAVRLEGTSPGHRCRISNCIVRGSSLASLTVQAPATELLVENSLLVSGNRPVFDIAAGSSAGTTLRMARTTAVAGENLLELRGLRSEDIPSLQFIGWDSVLTRSNTVDGGSLIRIVDNKPSTALQWRAVNCDYAGWTDLLVGNKTIQAVDWATWIQRFQTGDTDRAGGERWPKVSSGELAIRPSADYQIKPDSPVAFYRTPLTERDKQLLDKLGPIGCDVSTLPELRDNWLFLSYDRKMHLTERAPTPLPKPYGGTSLPEVPPAEPGTYAGEVFNPGTAKEPDLGLHLQNVKKANRLASKVVIRLTGTGEWPTSPIKLPGVELTLCYDPGDTKEPRSFALVPKGKFTGQESLIEADNNLTLIGVDFHTPHKEGKDVCPVHIVRVTRGNLLMHGCKLYGPLQHVEAHRSLLRIDGDDTRHDCVLDECVFVNSGTIAEVVGGQMPMRMQGCLAVSGQEILRMDFSAVKSTHLRMPCLLEQNTLAARTAVIHVDDAAQFGVPAEPCMFLARNNVFWAPFLENISGKPPRSGMLACHPDAIVHGTFLWYGEDNIYDKRLHYAFAPPDAPPKSAQDLHSWSTLWSCDKDIAMICEGKPPPQVTFTNPSSVETLTCPAEASSRDPVPGADFVKLGLRKPKGS